MVHIFTTAKWAQRICTACTSTYAPFARNSSSSSVYATQSQPQAQRRGCCWYTAVVLLARCNATVTPRLAKYAECEWVNTQQQYCCSTCTTAVLSTDQHVANIMPMLYISVLSSNQSLPSPLSLSILLPSSTRSSIACCSFPDGGLTAVVGEAFVSGRGLHRPG